ncbi:unnamed protein product [Acanthosepion pharaonis]|uniref:Uncharacterized protein n=1 Tax=Acanthosepion pharaonis TaxID=158019 RepID=A0A812DR78_ACAPH|nr:unnamed protein product [Sepia pharaonis]
MFSPLLFSCTFLPFHYVRRRFLSLSLSKFLLFFYFFSSHFSPLLQVNIHFLSVVHLFLLSSIFFILFLIPLSQPLSFLFSLFFYRIHFLTHTFSPFIKYIISFSPDSSLSLSLSFSPSPSMFLASLLHTILSFLSVRSPIIHFFFYLTLSFFRYDLPRHPHFASPSFSLFSSRASFPFLSITPPPTPFHFPLFSLSYPSFPFLICVLPRPSLNTHALP